MKKGPSISRQRNHFTNYRDNWSVLYKIVEWGAEKDNSEIIKGKKEASTKISWRTMRIRESSRKKGGQGEGKEKE